MPTISDVSVGNFSNALQIYQKACEKFPTDTSLMVGIHPTRRVAL